MSKQELRETIKKLYGDLRTYFNPHSEYGIGYVDGIYDICAKLGINCSKVDEGELTFAED